MATPTTARSFVEGSSTLPHELSTHPTAEHQSRHRRVYSSFQGSSAYAKCAGIERLPTQMRGFPGEPNLPRTTTAQGDQVPQACRNLACTPGQVSGVTRQSSLLGTSSTTPCELH